MPTDSIANCHYLLVPTRCASAGYARGVTRYAQRVRCWKIEVSALASAESVIIRETPNDGGPQ